MPVPQWGHWLQGICKDLMDDYLDLQATLSWGAYGPTKLLEISRVCSIYRYGARPFIQHCAYPSS